MLSTIAAINFASHLSEDRRRQGLGLPADLAILCNPELTFRPPEDRWSSSNAATRTNGQQHFRRTFTFSMDSPTQQFSPWVSSLNSGDETQVKLSAKQKGKYLCQRRGNIREEENQKEPTIGDNWIWRESRTSTGTTTSWPSGWMCGSIYYNTACYSGTNTDKGGIKCSGLNVNWYL